MTSTEILNEIQKMPLNEKRRVLMELAGHLEQVEEIDPETKEKKFLSGLRQKGLIAETPLRLPDDELRRNFKRIEIKGEPLSETIIKERG